MNTEQKLNDQERKLHAQIRAKHNSLPPAERSRYAAEVRKRFGAAEFRRIVGAQQPEVVSAEQARSRAEMDRRMGLEPQQLGCRREGTSLVAGIMSVDSPRGAATSTPRSGGALPTPPPCPPSQRPTAAGKPTRLSPDADEMDRRMGLERKAFTIRRSPTELVFSMVGD